jgi:hypothetical protein
MADQVRDDTTAPRRNDTLSFWQVHREVFDRRKQRLGTSFPGMPFREETRSILTERIREPVNL